jgi:hypothetical protein
MRLSSGALLVFLAGLAVAGEAARAVDQELGPTHRGPAGIALQGGHLREARHQHATPERLGMDLGLMEDAHPSAATLPPTEMATRMLTGRVTARAVQLIGGRRVDWMVVIVVRRPGDRR